MTRTFAVVKTILIVEDNDMTQKLVRTILAREGYRTIFASSGEDAISLAKEHLPDLILMDIGLPGMNGIEAISVLKSDEATRSIPVIMLSAHAMPEPGVKSAETGIVDYIAKPFSLQEFVETIRRNMP